MAIYLAKPHTIFNVLQREGGMKMRFLHFAFILLVSFSVVIGFVSHNLHHCSRVLQQGTTNFCDRYALNHRVKPSSSPSSSSSPPLSSSSSCASASSFSDIDIVSTTPLSSSSSSSCPSSQYDSNWKPLLTSFRAAWLRGLLSGNTDELSKLMPSGIKWKNPIAGETEQDFKEALQQFSEFFTEPALTFFDKEYIDDGNTVIVSFQLSFWYPTPWRPRVIIPGKITLKATSDEYSSLISVDEVWDLSVFAILKNSLFPRFWDLWHSFSSPSPEYPPIKKLGSAGKVSFVEMPQTVVIDIKWQGLAKFPGPSLLTLPGFGLFGFLRTSRPNRDPYYTVLPAEVESGRFASKGNDGAEMKQSSWRLHVPTSLQDQLSDQIRTEQVFTIEKTSLLGEDTTQDGESDMEIERDYQVGLENIEVMKSIRGASRGENINFDRDKMKTFENAEVKSYSYKKIPRRLLATIDIEGDPTTEKIGEKVKELKKVAMEEGAKVLGKEVVMKCLEVNSIDGIPDKSPKIGFQLWSCKGGFNMKGEPVMAVYEMQYGYRLTKMYVELEI